MYKIEKGITIPAGSRGNGGGLVKYPFLLMEIGDSFLVPVSGTSNVKVMRSLNTRGTQFKPKKFQTRVVKGGIRVWRVE